MNVSTANLPDDSWAIDFSYELALQIVNQNLNCAVPIMYTQAVYNLAADNLVNYAPDPTNPASTYWSDLRAKWNIYKFVPGVVQNSSDEGTSVGYVIQDAAKELTIANLQNLKTPWGRAYLGITQAYGPAVWGLS